MQQIDLHLQQYIDCPYGTLRFMLSNNAQHFNLFGIHFDHKYIYNIPFTQPNQKLEVPCGMQLL